MSASDFNEALGIPVAERQGYWARFAPTGIAAREHISRRAGERQLPDCPGFRVVRGLTPFGSPQVDFFNFA